MVLHRVGDSSFVPPRDELDCQYNANNTGDDTLYFLDQRGQLSGSGCNGLPTI